MYPRSVTCHHTTCRMHRYRAPPCGSRTRALSHRDDAAFLSLTLAFNRPKPKKTGYSPLLWEVLDAPRTTRPSKLQAYETGLQPYAVRGCCVFRRSRTRISVEVERVFRRKVDSRFASSRTVSGNPKSVFGFETRVHLPEIGVQPGETAVTPPKCVFGGPKRTARFRLAVLRMAQSAGS
jgi:hypothetical protein